MIEIGRCYRMEMKVGKLKVKRISRQHFPTQIIMDRKQLKNVVYFNSFGSMVTNDTRCTWDIKFRIDEANAAFKKEEDEEEKQKKRRIRKMRRRQRIKEEERGGGEAEEKKNKKDEEKTKKKRRRKRRRRRRKEE